MFESDCSDDEIPLSYKSVTGFTKKEDIPLKLWAEHFSKPEKDRNTSLTKIFEKEFNFLKSLYCFLENDQVMGKTLTKFGIPNICGKINKKFVKLSSKRSYKGNRYERRNKMYLSKPHLLSKKLYFKPPISKKPETSKHKNAAPSATPIVARTYAELANKTAYDHNTQKRREGIENYSPIAPVLDEMKGLLKQNDKKYGFKKCVRFNDNDLCSFAPTQEFLESLSRELSNSEIICDEIRRDKSVLTLSDNDKSCETVSYKTEQKTSAETNDLGNTSAIMSLGIINLQESVGGSKMTPKQSFENVKLIETDFEVEPYDNENIVIEEFTESCSDNKNQVEQEKGILLNLEPGINETTEGYMLNTIGTVQINKNRNEQLVVSNNLSVNEITKARNLEQKPAEETNKSQTIIENKKKIKEYFLNSKSKIKISEKSLCSSQGKNISEGKSVYSHLNTHSRIGSSQTNDNSKTKENLFEIRDTLIQTSSQQQSNSNELNVSESKNIIVPETPSSDGTTESKSCKSNVFTESCQSVVPNSSEESQLSKPSVKSPDSNAVVLEIPPSNNTSAGSRSLTIDKTSLNFLESRVENYIQKESHLLNTNSSAHLLVEDWSDDEFIPLSPLQPQNHNESSVNITTINGSIISSHGVGNQVSEDNCLKSVLITQDEQFENTSNSFGILSPCSSLSGRDYVSDSSECEEEELLSTKEKYESSNLNTCSQNAKDLKITQEAEINAKNSVCVKENEVILNDLHIEISFPKQTNTDSSNLCTPISELQTRKVDFTRQIQTSFAVNAPSKVEKNSQTDSSTVEKSKENASREEENNNGFNLMKYESLNPTNPIQTLLSENKVRKILFPLQTQASVSEIKNEAKINDSKLVYMTTNSLNILNLKEIKEVKESETQHNQKPIEEKNKKDICFSNMNLLNKDLNNSEMVNGAFNVLNSEKESEKSHSLSSKSGTGSPSNDFTVTETIGCEYEVNEGDEYKSSSFISCSQAKNEDSFSVCPSIQNYHDTNLSSHNECALIPLALSKEKEKLSASDNSAKMFKDKNKSQEVLSKPEASSIDNRRKNTHPDLNYKNLAGSEMDISMNDEVSTNRNLPFLNTNLILKIDNVSVESEKIQNNNFTSHPCESLQFDKSQEHPTKVSEDEINRNTLLDNGKACDTSDKQESALCSDSFSADASKQLNINLGKDFGKTLQIENRTSFTTTKTPIKVCTDNEKSHGIEYESLEQMTEIDSNKESSITTTSEHSKATNISNQTIARSMFQTVTSINSIHILPSSAIKPHLPTKQIVNSGKSSSINSKEDSTTMESIKITSKIKSEVLNTIKSIKVNNKKALKENKSIIQSEHEDYIAISPTSTLPASSNNAHVLSHAEIGNNITYTQNTANNTNRGTSPANESQLLKTQSVTSSIQSRGIHLINSMGTAKQKLPPTITNETLVTPEFIRVRSIKEQNENKSMTICENDNCNKEAPFSTSNVHSNSTNIPSYANENINSIDNVSANIGDKIFTKRQNVASQISSGVNNQSTGDDSGSINKRMSQIKRIVTSSSININSHRKKGFSELNDFMIETCSQQHSDSESKGNEKLNSSEICFTPGKEASKATEFPLVPTTSYGIQQLRNDTRALSSSEKRLKTTNQSELYIKQVEQNKNVDKKSRLSDNSPVKDLPKRNANLYSSNVILLSNEASLHNQSKLPDPHKNQISGRKRDNLKIDKCSKSIHFTTNNISVKYSRNGQNYESIACDFTNHQEQKSVPEPHQTKQLKKCQVLISKNTIKTQTQTPKLDILIKKSNASKNKNQDSLRINSSRENKTGPILQTTKFIPISNRHNKVQQAGSVHPKSIELEIKNKSSGILLSTGNLCVVRSSSHNQHQKTDKTELLERSDQISKKHNNQNVIGYKSLSTIKLQNCKQDNSKEEIKHQTQMQQQQHKLSTECQPKIRQTQNQQWRSDKHSELKQELTNVSIREHMNKNVISYISSSKIKPLRFSQGNLNEAEYKSLIEDSPPDSDEESFYLDDSVNSLDKQLSMNDKGGFESLLTSDDESVQGFSGSIGCTNGNFSPQSPSGSDMLSNEIFSNNSKSSNKRLKRRFLENLDNYASDDSNFEAGPTKFTRKNMLSASSKENNTLVDGNTVSSDDYVPSFHADMSEHFSVESLSSNKDSRFLDISPQYDPDMTEMSSIDNIKGSNHNETMNDSPIPSYSDGQNNDYLMSSPTSPDDCGEINSPFADSNCQSSDEDRTNYYFTDMFDD